MTNFHSFPGQHAPHEHGPHSPFTQGGPQEFRGGFGGDAFTAPSRHNPHGVRATHSGARMGFGAPFGAEAEDARGGFAPRERGGRRGGGFRAGRGPGWGGEGHPGFEPGFGPQGGGRRGPGRGRKGDVRAAIIALLAEQPMNGYQLINAISEKSSGLWSPSAGSVYPALGLLEDEGLIAPTEEDGKKLFALTDAGTAYAQENAEQIKAPWDRVAGPHKAMLDLRPELHQLNAAVQQLATSGEAEQVESAREVLVKARQNIYRLLAGDAPQD